MYTYVHVHVLLLCCRDLLKPADEVAEDVLESFPDIEADSEPPETPLSPDESKFILKDIQCHCTNSFSCCLGTLRLDKLTCTCMWVCSICSGLWLRYSVFHAIDYKRYFCYSQVKKSSSMLDS